MIGVSEIAVSNANTSSRSIYSCATIRYIVVRLEGDDTRLSTSAEPSNNVQEDTFLNPERYILEPRKIHPCNQEETFLQPITCFVFLIFLDNPIADGTLSAVVIYANLKQALAYRQNMESSIPFRISSLGTPIVYTPIIGLYFFIERTPY